MSLACTQWAWREIAARDLSAAEALVLLRVADQADLKDDGRYSCWPGIGHLARKTGRGEKTVRRAIVALEDQGLLIRERRGREGGGGRSADLLILPVDGHPDRSERPVRMTGSEGSSGHPVRLKRSSSPPEAVILSGSSGHLVPPIDRRNQRETKEETEREPARPHVDGIEATLEELEQARVIIATFATEAQQRFTADAWQDRVIRCLRAHPDVTVQDHVALIAAAFRNPWWTGSPTPAVIYSSVAQFEGQLADWRAGSPGRKTAGSKEPPGMANARRLAAEAERLEKLERQETAA